MTYGPEWEIPHCSPCVAERVRNKLTDLLAENNSRTQVSTRFTDQVQTKEPVGNQ